jgi:ferredoxin/protein involved in ribonucleotide reduction
LSKLPLTHFIKLLTMKTTIYYFSATGNSLNFARNIAFGLGDTELVSIARSMESESVETTAERIGLIFPVFAWGVPRIVVDFLEKVNLKNKRYIFGIATCVAIPGNTLAELKILLAGKSINLDAAFVVRSGRSSLMKLNMLDEIIKVLDTRRKKIKTDIQREQELILAIKSLMKNNPETSSWAANLFGSMFHDMGLKSFRSADKDFVIRESCKGCGNCSKICPRGNITIENGRPDFHHNCELCHACIQWCPNFAIQHRNFDTNLSQYHHPSISIRDMILK